MVRFPLPARTLTPRRLKGADVLTPEGHTYVAAFAVALAPMLALWFLSIGLRNASIVDPFWGTGFVLIAWTAWALHAPTHARVLLLVVLTTIWGLRLSLFLLWRNWGHGEDRRYGAMRSKHGDRFWWVSLFTVFLLQAAILWWVSLPLQAAAITSAAVPFNWLDLLGIALWSAGIVFETVGDWQLARFKSKESNRGKVLDTGLWRYTRHPNYFGDFCVWWGIFLIAASGGAWWTVGSPLAMSFLLMKLSGVPLLERGLVERRPQYAQYQARTNAFFPGPRRKA